MTKTTRLKTVSTRPSAPEHLSERSKALWAEVERSYVLEATERELLRLACEALDRCEETLGVVGECSRRDAEEP